LSALRILKVTQVYYPFLEKGGPATKVRAVAERLAARGHRVTVLTSTYGPAKPAGIDRANGVEAVYLAALTTYRSTTLNPGLIAFCRNRLREFDLVHIYGLYDLLGPTVAWFCRRRNIPYAVEPLGMVRPMDRSFPTKRLWHALLGNSCLRNAAVIVATSKQEHRELLAGGFAPEKLLLRYNGVALEEFAALPPRGTFRSKRGIPLNAPVLLFLGRLIPRKGADLLIQAFATACPQQGFLVIAGPEGERGYLGMLRAKAEALGLERRILFTGPLFGEQKKEALTDCDVFVLPSRYENFGNAAAEAIACCRPVIVTDCCGISELVEQRAGLVIPYGTQALGKAISELLHNRPLYERFQAQCKEVASRMGWDALMPEMEQCYLLALSGVEGRLRERTNAAS